MYWKYEQLIEANYIKNKTTFQNKTMYIKRNYIYKNKNIYSK